MITAVCKTCGKSDDLSLKRTFLGFRKVSCLSCGISYKQPLSLGFYITYVLMVITFGWGLVNHYASAISDGVLNSDVILSSWALVLLSLAPAYAIIRSLTIRKSRFKKILLLIGLVVLWALGSIYRDFISTSYTGDANDKPSNASIDEVLIKSTNEINKTLPRMVNADTRLDSVLWTGSTYRYFYTLINTKADDIDELALEHLVEEELRPMLVNRVCTTKEIKWYLDNGIPVSYWYYGKEGKNIVEIVVTSSDC